jgi:hypothetical protein
MDVDYNRTEDVSLEHISDWTSYCTRQSDMDAPQYVHDVHSNVSVAWMFYNTYHNKMDAPQYKHV